MKAALPTHYRGNLRQPNSFSKIVRSSMREAAPRKWFHDAGNFTTKAAASDSHYSLSRALFHKVADYGLHRADLHAVC